MGTATGIVADALVDGALVDGALPASATPPVESLVDALGACWSA